MTSKLDKFLLEKLYALFARVHRGIPGRFGPNIIMNAADPRKLSNISMCYLW